MLYTTINCPQSSEQTKKPYCTKRLHRCAHARVLNTSYYREHVITAEHTYIYVYSLILEHNTQRSRVFFCTARQIGFEIALFQTRQQHIHAWCLFVFPSLSCSFHFSSRNLIAANHQFPSRKVKEKKVRHKRGVVSRPNSPPASKLILISIRISHLIFINYINLLEQFLHSHIRAANAPTLCVSSTHCARADFLPITTSERAQHSSKVPRKPARYSSAAQRRKKTRARGIKEGRNIERKKKEKTRRVLNLHCERAPHLSTKEALCCVLATRHLNKQ